MGRLAGPCHYGVMAVNKSESSYPDFSPWHNRVAELSVDGELRAYLTCRVDKLRDGSPWPLYVMVWLDGTTEMVEEDYGPDWWSFDELQAGYFEAPARPAIRTKRRLFGRHVWTSVTHCDEWVPYTTTWLNEEEAVAVRARLGLS